MIEMKERTLRARALMDSAVLSAAAAEESESGPVTVARGSIEQVFFSMAGGAFSRATWSSRSAPVRGNSNTARYRNGGNFA